MNNKLIKAACLQMNSSAEVEQNLQFIAQQLSVAEPMDILVLPENFAQMPASRKQQYSESADNGEVTQFLLDLSIEHNITIVAGSLPVKAPDSEKPFARCYLLHAGQIIAHYDKLHLFDVDINSGTDAGAANKTGAVKDNTSQCYRESDTYQHGVLTPDQPIPISLEIGANTVLLGPSICYDLRFPELYRHYAAQGAQVMTVPSAFTYDTGKAHWECLLRARAIENQTFILAAGQVGEHANGRRTWGHSMMVDPLGRILSQKKADTGLLYADLDLNQKQRLQTTFPVLQHRRL